MQSKNQNVGEAEDIVNFNAAGFQFSGASIDTLESTEYTLVTICLDKSLSIQPFAQDMENALKSVISSCTNSPRSDNLIVRLVTFGETVDEFHGFKELNKCQLTDYDGSLSKLGNRTTLYDAMYNGLKALNEYVIELNSFDYSTNGLFVTITDGLDNYSSQTPPQIKKLKDEAVGENKLESLVSILVGVNTADNQVSKELKNLANAVGMEFLDIKDATPKSLAKLAQFISKSISSQSKALNTGVAAAVSSLQF